MRWPLLLIFVAPVSASEFDIDAAGFWSKSYSIPRSYCERHIRVSSEHVDKLIKAAAPCEFTINDGRAASDCQLSPEQAEKTATRLRHLGTLISYSQHCDPAPANPELYYKLDNLTREYEELGLPNDKLPAVTGLMIAQLDTLNALISSHETALQSVLAIDILPPDAAASAVTDQFPRTNHKKAVKRAVKKIKTAGSRLEAARGGWTRQSRPVCSQIAPVSVVYGRLGEPADSKRLEAIRRLGEAYADPACPHLRAPRFAAAIFSVKPEKEILRAMTALPDLRSWIKDSSLLADGFVTDDRRFDELSSELESHRAELERTPHIRALVTAEIERVRENAARLKKLRKGRLILVWFAD